MDASLMDVNLIDASLMRQASWTRVIARMGGPNYGAGA